VKKYHRVLCFSTHLQYKQGNEHGNLDVLMCWICKEAIQKPVLAGSTGF